MTDRDYEGGELELFQHATNWKNYCITKISPFIQKNVLEVGAGLGANTAMLANLNFDSWICLEPDKSLFEKLKSSVDILPSKEKYTAIHGILKDVPSGKKFDTVIYIDVLEHIEKDYEELQAVAKVLNTGGHIILLSPAHNWLYSEFDKSIGHFRRYNKSMLENFRFTDMEIIKNIYLDSVGMLASTANKLILKQSNPNKKQILFWDRMMVPLSRYLFDPILFFSLGKSILTIYQKK